MSTISMNWSQVFFVAIIVWVLYVIGEVTWKTYQNLRGRKRGR
jgi:hypothetical protein